MINRSYPVGLQDWPALRIGNRNEGRSVKCFEDRLMLRQIKSAMQSGYEWGPLSGKERKGVIVEVEM